MSTAQPSTILVVDDNDDCRSVMKELLEENGFSVSEASDGGAALALLTSSPEPALMILDLEMPVMTGGELIARMTEHERLADIPVLIVSGSTKASVPKRRPVIGFMSKPLRFEDLLRAIAEVLAARQPHATLG
jgi:CheY-like chemotaxis protein